MHHACQIVVVLLFSSLVKKIKSSKVTSNSLVRRYINDLDLERVSCIRQMYNQACSSNGHCAPSSATFTEFIRVNREISRGALRIDLDRDAHLRILSVYPPKITGFRFQPQRNNRAHISTPKNNSIFVPKTNVIVSASIKMSRLSFQYKIESNQLSSQKISKRLSAIKPNQKLVTLKTISPGGIG